MPHLDFWYSIGSTYSYLTVMRIGSEAEKHGVTVRWRPFNVRTVMQAQSNIPFAGKPEKSAYMWRDIGRRAASYGLSPALPARYPIDDLALANQVALLGMGEDWGEDFTRTLYRLWFEEGQPAGDAPVMQEALTRIGQPAADVMDRAKSKTAVAALERETVAATNAGLFGAPSFTVEDELFWGDDRLGDAFAWAQKGRL